MYFTKPEVGVLFSNGDNNIQKYKTTCRTNCAIYEKHTCSTVGTFDTKCHSTINNIIYVCIDRHKNIHLIY